MIAALQETVPGETILGTEMEWSILWRGRDSYCGDAIPMNSYYLKMFVDAYCRTVPAIGNGSHFLSNGSRLYVDIGDHLETTTPEDTIILGTVASEMANEHIVRDILEQKLIIGNKEILQVGQFALNNRVVDGFGNSWGYHESYCTDGFAFRPDEPRGLQRKELDPSKLTLLGVHMATRGIYAGAGVLKPDGTFHVAQKASCSNEDYSNSTSEAGKAVVNLRDEQLADDRYARVHVTSGDPTMSPWSKRMALGTTKLVVALGAYGIPVPGLELANSLVSVSRAVAKDIRVTQPLKLRQGDVSSAVAIQQRLLEAAKTLPVLSEEDQWTLAEWERALSVIEQDPLLLSDRADWPMKYKMLARHHEKHGLAWKSDTMQSRERQWDEIGPRGIALVLRERLWQQWMPPETLIVERITQPPKTTRAHIRGKFVQMFSGHSGAHVDWKHIGVGNNIVSILNPYNSYDPRAEAIFADQRDRIAS